MKVPEFPNDAWAYIPETYRAGTPHGLLLWLHAPEAFEWDELVAQWKPQCDRDSWILLAPKSGDPKRWDRTELPLVRKLVDQISADYSIDPARIVLAGHDVGGAMAMLAASQNRDVVRGVAIVDAPLAARIAPNEPQQPLAFYVVKAAGSKHAAAVDKSVEQLREAKYPVTVKSLGEEPRLLEAEERAELSRWIDTLDRL